jgi:hypothetical protein
MPARAAPVHQELVAAAAAPLEAPHGGAYLVLRDGLLAVLGALVIPGGPGGVPVPRVMSASVQAAFMAAGIAIIVQLWWLFWLSAAVVVLSIPACGLIPRTLTGNHRQL